MSSADNKSLEAQKSLDETLKQPALTVLHLTHENLHNFSVLAVYGEVLTLENSFLKK